MPIQVAVTFLAKRSARISIMITLIMSLLMLSCPSSAFGHHRHHHSSSLFFRGAMSLDNLHNDYHNAWIEFCGRVQRTEIRNAMSEFGVDGFRRMCDQDSQRVLNQQQRHVQLQRSASMSTLGRLPSGGALPSTRRSGSSCSSSHHRREVENTVRETVRQQVAEESRALQAKLKETVSKRRKLQEEIRRVRTSASQPAPIATRSAAYFVKDPNWELRPLPPMTKRAVMRVDLSGAVPWYAMG
eukprot:TRINITY_DN8991_c0_g1_i1.p1 TRINITY_DN8991_c0_g1~~TRINITY_DN8991_c0_g1_i1.p1  ORF type:complete len:242 (+),score=38.17 TRINITY_DN8991_c0_g1_i1:17-742(+)